MKLAHAMYEPPGNGPHPTILALHGWGAGALDLVTLAPHLADGRFMMLCPQGRTAVPLGPTQGYGWYPLVDGAPADPGAFRAGVAEIRQFLDEALERYPVKREKLIVLGFSQGGAMAYALGFGEPSRFAGLITLSSWLPEAVIPSLEASGCQELATLIHHGTHDELIPLRRGRDAVETLRTYKVPVAYREFEMGHEVSAESLGALSQWLDEKILAPLMTL